MPFGSMGVFGIPFFPAKGYNYAGKKIFLQKTKKGGFLPSPLTGNMGGTGGDEQRCLPSMSANGDPGPSEGGK